MEELLVGTGAAAPRGDTAPVDCRQFADRRGGSTGKQGSALGSSAEPLCPVRVFAWLRLLRTESHDYRRVFRHMLQLLLYNCSVIMGSKTPEFWKRDHGVT